MKPLSLSPSIRSKLASLTLLAVGLVYWGGMPNGAVPKWGVLVASFLLIALLTFGCRFMASRPLVTGGLFLGWSLLSLSWSPDWMAGAQGFVLMGIAFALFLAVRQWGAWRLPEIATLTALGVVVLGTVHPRIWGGFGNENLVAEFLVCLLPFVVWCAFQGSLRLWVSALTGLWAAGYLIWNPSYVELAALWGALCAFLALKRWWWTLAFTVVVPIDVVVATDWIGMEGPVLSALARVEFTTNTLFMWLDAPLFGSGLGSFDYLYPEYQEAYARVFDFKTSLSLINFAGAAHNDYAQLLADLGIVGAGLAGLFVWSALSDRSLKGPAFWSLVMLACLALIEFPLQTPATVALGAICLGALPSRQSQSLSHTATSASFKHSTGSG